MKKLYRNFIGAVAIASLAICMLPGLEVKAATVTPVNVPASGKMSIAELQQAFPHGKYWNRSLDQTGYSPYQYTDTPCKHTIPWDEYSKIAETCNTFKVGNIDGLQCAGFAYMMSYLYNYGTGVSPEDLELVALDDIDDIQVGDHVRDLHSVFVTEILGNGKLRVGEANKGYDCSIKWGGVINLNSQAWEETVIHRLVPKGTLERNIESLDEEYGTVYRFYNPRTGVHIYTRELYDGARLLVAGWQREKSAGLAENGEGGRAIYQLRNNTTREILYTGDSNEVKVLSNRGWTVENDEFPVFYASDSGTKHVYRLYCPNNPPITSHHYTSDLNEIKVLTQERGYVQDNGGKPIFSLR